VTSSCVTLVVEPTFDCAQSESLDNGLRSCPDPAALQAACDAIGLTDVIWKGIRRESGGTCSRICKLQEDVQVDEAQVWSGQSAGTWASSTSNLTVICRSCRCTAMTL